MSGLARDLRFCGRLWSVYPWGAVRVGSWVLWTRLCGAIAPERTMRRLQASLPPGSLPVLDTRAGQNGQGEVRE